MENSINPVIFNEDKKLALIEAVGQLEVLAGVYFNISDCSDTDRQHFYISTIFQQLITRVKKLIDELIAILEQK